jgi:hypothetical protein
MVLAGAAVQAMAAAAFAAAMVLCSAGSLHCCWC